MNIDIVDGQTLCHPQNWKYTTYHNGAKRGPSHEHRQQQQHNTTTILRPIYRPTGVSRHLQLKFYCPHALADGIQCIWIREKMLEFSSTVLSTLSLYLPQATCTENLVKFECTKYMYQIYVPNIYMFLRKVSWQIYILVYARHITLLPYQG